MSLLRSTLALMLSALACNALAQTYPSKPIRMVVPWPPGGTNDILGRSLAEPLGRTLGQQVIVDNRGGSNGVIGAEAVARAPGDGYTIMFHSITSHVTNPAVYKKLAYDTINDFTPVTQIAWVPLVIVVHPSFPAKNVRELIAIAKSQPGQVNYASFGQGSMSHLAGELLKMMAKIDIVHIPYKGGGPALIDALAGHVPVYLSSIAPSLPNIKAGRLRVLGLTGTDRSKQLPDVPTVAETPGLKGYDATIMYAIWAPAKTPREIVNQLHGAIVKVIHTPQFKERLDFRRCEPADRREPGADGRDDTGGHEKTHQAGAGLGPDTPINGRQATPALRFRHSFSSRLRTNTLNPFKPLELSKPKFSRRCPASSEEKPHRLVRPQPAECRSRMLPRRSGLRPPGQPFSTDVSLDRGCVNGGGSRYEHKTDHAHLARTSAPAPGARTLPGGIAGGLIF